jgi:hypothetical protein
MRNFAAVLLAAVVLAGPALATTTENSDAAWSFVEPDGGAIWGGSRDVLYDNGPIFNSAGTGFGGADESILQDQTLLSSTYGWGAQIVSNNRMADDFMVPAGETWTIESITFFFYQTGSSTTSTINDVRFEIHDGYPPANVLYGDQTTNQLFATSFANTYRTLESSPGATNRPMMACECVLTPALELTEGQYWVAFFAGGTLSSGPWAPPVVIWNTTYTGDCLQSIAGGAFTLVTDAGDGDTKGMPFIISGPGGPTETDATSWGAVKTLFK